MTGEGVGQPMGGCHQRAARASGSPLAVARCGTGGWRVPPANQGAGCVRGVPPGRNYPTVAVAFTPCLITRPTDCRQASRAFLHPCATWRLLSKLRRLTAGLYGEGPLPLWLHLL